MPPLSNENNDCDDQHRKGFLRVISLDLELVTSVAILWQQNYGLTFERSRNF